VDKLIRQNNKLIEQIRNLEKEKNGVYQELKMTSPLKLKHSNRDSKSAKKKPNEKSERWRVIEEKLKVIRSENEQLKVHLTID
jgi:hypothetical protein